MESRSHVVRSGRYSLHVLELGNPDGYPILFLHGGPGSGSDPSKATLFDLEKCRLFFLDQRGAGKSTPTAGEEPSKDALADNTLQELVNDIHVVKETLDISQPWALAGNSFGSALALSYSICAPNEVAGLLLWGVFLCRSADLSGMFAPHGRAANEHSSEYQRFLDFLPREERSDPVSAYTRRVWSQDRNVREDAAWQWATWNRELYYTQPKSTPERTAKEMLNVMNYVRLVQHYFSNNAFLPEIFGPSRGNNQLLEQAHRVPDIPVHLVHGEVDAATPLENALLLNKALGALPRAHDSTLAVVPGASHSSSEPGFLDTLKSRADALMVDLGVYGPEMLTLRSDRYN